MALTEEDYLLFLLVMCVIMIFFVLYQVHQLNKREDIILGAVFDCVEKLNKIKYRMDSEEKVRGTKSKIEYLKGL